MCWLFIICCCAHSVCVCVCVGGGMFGSCFVMLFNVSFSSFAIILLRKREIVALLYLCYWCRVVVCVLCLFFFVPWVGLWYLFVTSLAVLL